ncbi:MAG: redoxin family protein [Cardiobacteriaceae bacterium]|nr:redoxin family protein [Cardiobacteriaceae bacterium]
MTSAFVTTALVVMFVMILALMAAVYSLARQIGVLYERIAPAGALAVNRQVRAGESAPSLMVKTIGEQTLQIGAGIAPGRAQLLFFLSPDCPVCKQLLLPLKSAAKAEKGWLDVILASDGNDAAAHKDFVAREGLEGYPYVLSEILGKSYGVSKLPYGVLIDDQGVISALGIINSREHLDSLFEAKALGVPDIQTYMARQHAPPSPTLVYPKGEAI